MGRVSNTFGGRLTLRAKTNEMIIRCGDKWQVMGFGRDKVETVLETVIKTEKPCENNGLRNWKFRLQKREVKRICLHFQVLEGPSYAVGIRFILYEPNDKLRPLEADFG